MTSYIVEHITYERGDKRTEEATFSSVKEARDFAYRMLINHGGRVWVNNTEYTAAELGRMRAKYA